MHSARVILNRNQFTDLITYSFLAHASFEQRFVVIIWQIQYGENGAGNEVWAMMSPRKPYVLVDWQNMKVIKHNIQASGGDRHVIPFLLEHFQA